MMLVVVKFLSFFYIKLKLLPNFHQSVQEDESTSSAKKEGVGILFALDFATIKSNGLELMT